MSTKCTVQALTGKNERNPHQNFWFFMLFKLVYHFFVITWIRPLSFIYVFYFLNSTANSNDKIFFNTKTTICKIWKRQSISCNWQSCQNHTWSIWLNIFFCTYFPIVCLVLICIVYLLFIWCYLFCSCALLLLHNVSSFI